MNEPSTAATVETGARHIDDAEAAVDAVLMDLDYRMHLADDPESTTRLIVVSERNKPTVVVGHCDLLAPGYPRKTGPYTAHITWKASTE